MLSQSLLIAEPNHRTLYSLSRTVCDHIPNIAIGACTSAEKLSHKVESFSYDAVALSPALLQAYSALRNKRTAQLLVPLIVTVCQRDLPVAQSALEGDAFDLIITPLVPSDAVQTVRLALWQNQLLKLLVSKERAVSRFQQHMEAFPHDPKAEELGMFSTGEATWSKDFLYVLHRNLPVEKAYFMFSYSQRRRCANLAIELFHCGILGHERGPTLLLRMSTEYRGPECDGH